MSERTLKVWGESGVFSIKIPEDAKVTFGPWAPVNPGSSTYKSGMSPERGGTLRIYKGTKTTGDVYAVFAGVQGFRDTSLEYEEEPRPMPAPALIQRVDWEDLDADEKEELAGLVAGVIVNRAADDALASKPAPDESEEEEIGPSF